MQVVESIFGSVQFTPPYCAGICMGRERDFVPALESFGLQYLSQVPHAPHSPGTQSTITLGHYYNSYIIIMPLLFIKLYKLYSNVLKVK